METAALIQKIAKLESMNDQLITELECLDVLSKKLGFSEGLTTLKYAAEELLRVQQNEDLDLFGLS